MREREVLAHIKTSGRRHYVYVLRRPDGRAFYVGVGTGRRLLDHAIFARRQNLDSHKLRVIRKLWRLEQEIDYTVHAFFDQRGDAGRAEAALIAEIGRHDLRAGPLTNVTAGGEGAPSPSDEVLSARSIKLRAAWAKRDKVAAMAHLNTPEVRAKTAATRTGLKRGPYQWTKNPGASPPEQRAAVSARLKADPVSRRPGVATRRIRSGMAADEHRAERWRVPPLRTARP